MSKTKIRRSLFIGLGGTGMKSILKTKSIMLDNYGQDGELPPMIAFLGIDTDANEYELPTKSKSVKDVTLSPRERFSISVNNPKEYFEYSKRDMTWMPSRNRAFINTLNRGAGQMRTNGRLAFMYNRERLKDRLRAALTDVSSSAAYSSKWKNFDALESGDDGNACTEVHLVFSLSGGTGCGTFIDVAYLLRDIARENNIDMTINGYGVLPGVFVEEIKNPTAKSRVQPNAYGALRDLDYLMSIPTDERLVKISWQDKETDETPFDSVILIDNKNTEGISYKRISDLTEMISLALLATTGQIGSQSKSVGDNVKNDMLNKAFDVDDKCAWVSAVGTACIMYDSEHVAKVYELKAQNRLIHKLFNYEEDENVIANNWIDNVRIRENEGKDQVIDRLFDISEVSLPALSDKDFDKRTVVEKIDQKLSMYYKETPSNEEWNNKVDLFFEEITKKLVEKEKELCNKSLELNKDFLLEVKGQINDIFMCDMRNELQDWEAERKNADADLKSQVEQLEYYLNHGLFHNKTDNYVSLIKSYAQNYLVADLEAKRRSYAIQFYSKLAEFIDGELNRVQETINKLKSIKDDNDKEIRDIQNHYGNSRTIVIDLAEERIKNVEVDKDDIVLVSDFVDKLHNKNLYETATKEEYVEILKSIASGLKGSAVIRTETIDDILNAMSEEEFNEVIQRSANHSKPFLNIDDHGILLKSTSRTVGQQEQFYICVPDVDTCRLTKDEHFRDIISSEEAETISTGLNDRIIIYRQKRPVPALAIGGLDTLRIPYERELERVSFHMDDFLEKRMNDEEYSFEPKKKNQDDALLAWVMGCVLGLIKFDAGKYWYQDDTVDVISDTEEHWVDTHSAYRDIAFEKFCTHDYLVKQYMDKFYHHLDNIGKTATEELAADVYANYFAKYSRCQLTENTINTARGYEETKKLINSEKKVRELIFKRN